MAEKELAEKIEIAWQRCIPMRIDGVEKITLVREEFEDLIYSFFNP